MVEKQSARRTLCFRARTAREAWANRLLFGRERGSASRRCLIPAGRTDGLWLAVAPFTSGAGNRDMTGMASGWQQCLPRPSLARPGREICSVWVHTGACPGRSLASKHLLPAPSQALVGTRQGRGLIASALDLAARPLTLHACRPQPEHQRSALSLITHPSSPFPPHTLRLVFLPLCSCVQLSDVSSPHKALPSGAWGPLHIPCAVLRLAQGRLLNCLCGR